MTEIIEGVSMSSSREQLFGAVRELAGKLHKREDKRLAALAKIEREVKEAYKGRAEDLLQVVATSTETEWHEGIDFLEHFEGYMPVSIYRIYDGVRTALNRLPEDAKEEVAPPNE